MNTCTEHAVASYSTCALTDLAVSKTNVQSGAKISSIPVFKWCTMLHRFRQHNIESGEDKRAILYVCSSTLFLSYLESMTFVIVVLRSIRFTVYTVPV